MKNVTAIILAAGKSTRMKSSKSKLLHKILGIPLIVNLLKTLSGLELQNILLVLGHQRGEIVSELAKNNLLENVTLVNQDKQLGTGHAVMCAIDDLDENGKTIVLAGDVPFLRLETLKTLIDSLGNEKLLSVLCTNLKDPTGYGRIVEKNKFISIVEEKEASPEEKKITLINSGIYCFNSKFLKVSIKELQNNNQQQEYYLTDLIGLASRKKKNSVVKIVAEGGSDEVLGMNDRNDLQKISKKRQLAINAKWMSFGVTIHDPERTVIEESVELSSDVEIFPEVFLLGKTQILKGTVIMPGAYIENSIIKENVTIKPYCVIESSNIEKNASIGPFAHLRAESNIGEGAKIGNFVETKKINFGKNSKASHLTYLGDAEIGNNVNIGCGTITCNYDGVNKHKTIIEDDVFIGSDNQLCAPVRVGKGAFTASGSTITSDIPENAFAIARSRQVTKEGYAKKFKKGK